MSEINVIIRSADLTRKAEICLSTNLTGEDLIQASFDNWALPENTDYGITNITTGQYLLPRNSLAINGVKDGDILEIQPVLVAG